MICEICQENEAAVTLIPTGEGMPQSVCPGCLHRMVLTTAKDYLPAEEIAAILGPMLVDPAREDLHDGAKQEQARRAPKAKAKAKPEAEKPAEPTEPAKTAEGE